MTDLPDLISRFVLLTHEGNEARAQCPFHADDGESLRIGETWRCLECCEQEVHGADAIGFLMSWSGCTRALAEEQLTHALPDPYPTQYVPLRRPPFWGIKALLDHPKAKVWIHSSSEAVNVARVLLPPPERVHLGLILHRPWDDLSLLAGRQCVLAGVPEDMERLAVALGRKITGIQADLSTSGITAQEVLTSKRVYYNAHPLIINEDNKETFNGAAQQDGGDSRPLNPNQPARAAPPRKRKADSSTPEVKSKPETQPAQPTQAVDGLLLARTGEVKACEHNAKTLIAGAKPYDDLFFDDFLCRVRLAERDWSDHDDRDALCWLQSSNRVAGFTLGQTRTAVLALAYARRRDSLLEFVMGVPEWDGTPRIEFAFIEAWGAPDTALNRAASRNLFIAMHARAVKPGSQVDNLWVIEGPQGALKSASLRVLGGSLHAEISASVGTADFLRELRGIWVAEMSELDSLRGREASTVKRLLSAPSDRFVDKYDRHALAYPRRAVVVATTNEANYWQDATGARRLIPIQAGVINLEMIKDNRLQWFAEARHEFHAGRTWWEFPSGAQIEQEERQIVDPWEDILRRAIVQGRIDNYGTVPWPTEWISSADIMRDWIKLDAGLQGHSSATRLRKVMRRLGFEPQRFGKGRERGWALPATKLKNSATGTPRRNLAG